MTLPISVYGNTILRKKAREIDKDYEGLNDLIKNMFETMNKADGIGLAGPQVGRSIRMFLIDATVLAEQDITLKDFKKVFINPVITEETGTEIIFEEGCLSLPNIHEDVKRRSKIKIEYYDENFTLVKEAYNGIKARVIQHEYDHLEGVLFTDKLSAFRKRLIKGRLAAISKGKIRSFYKMRFPRK
jgi:peptide deformylase